MKIFKHAALVLLFGSVSAMAAPVSEGSVRQLLEVTQAQKLVDGMRMQVDKLMDNAIHDALKGKEPNVAQQQAIDTMKKKIVALLQAEISWGKLEPMYLRLYQESFSEEEVAGMLAFYKTPSGQAVIYKLPGLMHKTLLEVQKMTSGMSPQMQQIQQDFAVEMTAASK